MRGRQPPGDTFDTVLIFLCAALCVLCCAALVIGIVLSIWG